LRWNSSILFGRSGSRGITRWTIPISRIVSSTRRGVMSRRPP
jgi:hypothetical protein